jgi:hypothetical protein
VIIQDVHIFPDWARLGHRIIVRGREYPGAPAAILKADGSWEPVRESGAIDPEAGDYGIRLPEGALDAIVAKHLEVAAPHPATERHLTDAIAVRDRLLALVEKRR